MKSGNDMRKTILTVLIAVAALSMLAACTTGVNIDEIYKEYPISVIIDYNGGKDGESVSQLIRCKENSLLPPPGTTSYFSEPILAGYEVGSYWVGTRGEDGEPHLIREWNFDTDRVTEDMTLFVIWQREKSIVFYYGENFSQTYDFRIIETTAGGNIFTRSDLESVAPKWKDHSFYAFYFDEACTEELQYPYVYADNPVDKLYAKYIEGTWKIVRDISDLTGIKSDTNVYLDVDIEDLSSYSGSIFPATYSGEFNGNGHTISNYSFTRSTSRGMANCYAGLINTLSAGAYIHDVVFANFKMTVTFGEPQEDGETNIVGLLAAVVQSGARIENVTLSGSVQYDESSSKRPVVFSGAYGTYEGEGSFDETYPTLTCEVTINE